ncbi:MAG: galactokinase [Spirochaetaceae bacterium]|nr:galactokinase [Spirochaetaceae bacterium]
MDLGTDIAAIHAKEYEITDTNERIIIAEAPGRIHFMGEHCQHGAGVCLSAGIDRMVRVAVSARKDNSLRFLSAEICERKRTTILNIHYKREDRWANHIKLALCLFAEKGCQLKGMNWTISSTVPQNIGLAAAEAIEVAAALALKRFFNSSINDKDIIMRLNELHKEFYPNESRAADFLVMLNARKDTLMIVDEATQEVTRIKSPVSRHKILIIDSKVPFTGVEEELKDRRASLDRGLAMLRKKRPAQSFKDFVGTDMLEMMGNLNEEVRRRSMHVVKELGRIAEIRDALEAADLQTVARIIFHSHESLRDLYEVTCPELDWLVKRAQEIEGTAGARMTGKGFGGCVYVILPSARAEEYLAKMEDYERIFGFHAVHYEVKPGAGARIITK